MIFYRKNMLIYRRKLIFLQPERSVKRLRFSQSGDQRERTLTACYKRLQLPLIQNTLQSDSVATGYYWFTKLENRLG